MKLAWEFLKQWHFSFPLNNTTDSPNWEIILLLQEIYIKINKEGQATACLTCVGRVPLPLAARSRRHWTRQLVTRSAGRRIGRGWLNGLSRGERRRSERTEEDAGGGEEEKGKRENAACLRWVDATSDDGEEGIRCAALLLVAWQWWQSNTRTPLPRGAAAGVVAHLSGDARAPRATRSSRSWLLAEAFPNLERQN